ncbi:ATP phosphoribosyltransferase [Kineococcus radiotolerans]|uniref:ATP phosphoribosyltransferase n=1 Tax=Kineococcus radiotolerans (strain ATCC BAA-149 / DSM 14245 / SRS30216) TaxID=266940 RepID=A6WCA0_KINRD|nr:ATP phosphoribosyltransferase [Kineococcus radiotolerans]ABS04439.1 ATP phosphoribosyltransferase [Kineococcus radiotolerans SRS30216 = ATCC BAA-149]
MPASQLRIAVPNKGALSEAASAMLREAGYNQRRDAKELILDDPDNSAQFVFLRPRDIALYVGSGTLDVGITGRDLLLDSRAPADEILPLGFARSTFRFAGRPGVASSVADLQGRRIATSYSGLLGKHLAEHGVTADVVHLDGAVETAVALGIADVIADVVETGTTLRAAGLEVFGEAIMRSEATLVRRAGAPADPAVDVLVRRLQGVLVARQYVMVDYDCPRDIVERACAVAPGLESPTVSPTANPDWVAVRVMVRKAATNQVMDELYDLGARAILVTSIHACRL